jgi:hypothetical protein
MGKRGTLSLGRTQHRSLRATGCSIGFRRKGGLCGRDGRPRCRGRRGAAALRDAGGREGLPHCLCEGAVVDGSEDPLQLALEDVPSPPGRSSSSGTAYGGRWQRERPLWCAWGKEAVERGKLQGRRSGSSAINASADVVSCSSSYIVVPHWENVELSKHKKSLRP